MNEEKESPEDRRERLRQKELKGSSSSSYQGSNLSDLVGGLGYKVTGIILLLLIIGVVIFFIIVR